MFRKLFLGSIPLLLLLLLVAAAGCRKDELLNSGGEVRFSTDTLTFDTVFTAQGSFTTSLRIYNPQNSVIRLSSVRLERGESSPFRLNVDGRPGTAVTDVEIAANDSAFVFATVKINPTAQDAPFIIEDRLVATLNGREFAIPFYAYGQNAYYIVDSVLQTTTWKKDRPYIILRNALVDSDAVLTIEAGARIYMHADSRLYVDGSLRVHGTKEDSVVFQGDRLDRAYFGYVGYPGEWGGLYFTENSDEDTLRHTIIKNCGASTRLGNGVALPAAIQVNSDIINRPVQLYMDRVTIMNSIGYGLLSFSGAVRADNCLVHSCGAQALALLQGGTYAFNNCTFSVYGSNRINHSENSVAAILNYYKPNDVTTILGNLTAVLTNCVIWGSLENELVADSAPGADASLLLDHCLVRRKDPLASFVTTSSPLAQSDPMFKDVSKDDYHQKPGSPLRDAGRILSGLLFDRDDKPRSNGYDVGCYEVE